MSTHSSHANSSEVTLFYSHGINLVLFRTETIYAHLVVLRIGIFCLSKVWYQVIGEILIPLVGWGILSWLIGMGLDGFCDF